MKRRSLLATAGLTVIATAARGQTKGPPRIGVLSDDLHDAALFREAMQERGWPPSAYSLEVRSAGGHGERLDELARELVAAKVDAIVAILTPAALAAKRATATIPIVMQAGDPVGNGVVASLAHPGGNVTGVDSAAATLGSKRVELLKEILPSLQRLALLINPPDPFSKSLVAQVQAAGATAKVAVEVVPAADLDAAMRELEKSRIEAVVVQPSLPLRRVAERLLAARLAGVSGGRLFVQAGGLLSINAPRSEWYRLLALCLDKILKGTPPSDIPVMQTSQFELSVNLATARRLGLTMPQIVMARADEVIE